MVDRTLAEVLEVVRGTSGRTDSLIAYNAQQKARVEELLAQLGTIPPDIQAGLNTIFDIETSDALNIDAAIAAPAPPPPV